MGGFLSLMLSVGHRTGLLDTLATLEPARSDRIAAAAGLNERYVREWLGAMVTGRIIEYDPATRTYWLPLHALMAESSHTTLEATLLTRTLPLVPGLVDRLEAGIDVVDMGCGEGVAIRMMAERFPRSRFVGVDLAAEAIATARTEAEAARLTNARFLAQDATTFSAPAAFDFITAFDAIHDQSAPRRRWEHSVSALRSRPVRRPACDARVARLRTRRLARLASLDRHGSAPMRGLWRDLPVCRTAPTRE